MENFIPPQAGLSQGQDEMIAMLTSTVRRAEYCYGHSFKMSKKEGEKSPAPIEIFYKLMDGMPNALKRSLDFNDSMGSIAGMQHFGQKPHVQIGTVDVSSYGHDCIHLRDDHDKHYIIFGSIELDKGKILNNGDQLDDYVEIYFRVRARSFIARKVMFLSKPLLKIICQKS